MAERSLFERCLDLCSSQAEREKLRSLAVRLHLSETASEWAILLLHAEGRALFGPRQKPAAPASPPKMDRRVLRLLGCLVAGAGISGAIAQHAPVVIIVSDLTMVLLYVAWAARSLAK